MITTRERLSRAAAVIETLKYCREVTGDESLGAAAERLIVDREIAAVLINTNLDDINHMLERIVRKHCERKS